MNTLCLGFFVNEYHLGFERGDLVIKGTRLLRGCCSLLALQCIFVLLVAADIVALGDNFCGLQHGHIGMLGISNDIWALCSETIAMFVLHQTD